MLKKTCRTLDGVIIMYELRTNLMSNVKYFVILYLNGKFFSLYPINGLTVSIEIEIQIYETSQKISGC